METISREYADLNAELHSREARYGSGAWRKADNVIELFVNQGHETILDYGCGKGTLAADLKDTIEIAEFDPAIPGKDAPPEPADLVCCFDVLEHVEPENLSETINHLHSLTKVELFATIATRPSSQTLADGRNAHLIIENAEWWKAQFDPLRWRISAWDDRGSEVWARLRPLHEIGDIRAKMAVSHEDRLAQVYQNIDRIPDRLTIPGLLKHEAHCRKAVLVCAGPSLEKTWMSAGLARFEDATDIVTVSVAHKFMIERGIIPSAHIDCDPRPHKVTQMGLAHPDVEYWLASCVHPSYIDHVAGGKLTALWHAYNGEASCDVLDREPGQRMIVGGGSVGLRAISLLYHLGYRAIEIHGMDCSFYEKGKQWAAEHHGKVKSEVEVVAPDGRVFLTAPALIMYYRFFMKQLSWMPDADVMLHGDGMLQHQMRLRSNDRDRAERAGASGDIQP